MLISTSAACDTGTARKLLDEKYIQHNTGIPDDVSGLIAAFASMAEQGISIIYDEVHMVLAVSEGSFSGVPASCCDLRRIGNSGF